MERKTGSRRRNVSFLSFLCWCKTGNKKSMGSTEWLRGARSGWRRCSVCQAECATEDEKPVQVGGGARGRERGEGRGRSNSGTQGKPLELETE